MSRYNPYTSIFSGSLQLREVKMTDKERPDRMSPGLAAQAVAASERASEQSEQPIISPLRFADLARACRKETDFYGTTRALMIVTLRSLGYGEGIDLISDRDELATLYANGDPKKLAELKELMEDGGSHYD